MARHTHLQWTSVAFAALWTTGLALWTSESGLLPPVMLAIFGVLAGAGWYQAMKRFQDGLLSRDH